MVRILPYMNNWDYRHIWQIGQPKLITILLNTVSWRYKFYECVTFFNKECHFWPCVGMWVTLPQSTIKLDRQLNTQIGVPLSISLNYVRVTLMKMPFLIEKFWVKSIHEVSFQEINYLKIRKKVIWEILIGIPGIPFLTLIQPRIWRSNIINW